MPSPDVSPYIDLVLVDKNPSQIFNAALLDLQTRLPDWVPAPASTEYMLLESLALEIGDAVFAINRVPSAVIDALLHLFQIVRDDGAPPTVTLEFDVSDAIGHTIPAGTRSRLDLSGGLAPVVFATDADLNIPPASSSGTITATGDRFTADANNLVAPITLALIDSVAFVDTVVTTTTIGAGRDPENDIAYFTRGIQTLARLTQALVVAQQFTNFALAVPGIYRAISIDNYNPVGPDPAAPGYITVFVYGQGGVAVDSGTKTDLQAAMQVLAAGMLSIAVEDPTITSVDVTAAIHLLPGYVFATVQAAVQDALGVYLSGDTWPWEATVRKNKIIQKIEDVDGVDWATVSLPTGDTTLTGPANLAVLGTATITQV